MALRIGSLFSGYGGLDLGVMAAIPDSEVVWHADIDKDANRILAHHWPDVPNLGDVSAVDWADVPPIDILTGGFPCQDVSTAGKRAGMTDGTRSGLWAMMADAVDHLRPSLVIIENVRGLLSARADSNLEPCPYCVGEGSDPPLRALGAVLGDLADLGYDATWGTFRASDVGACHRRERVFIVGHPADGSRVEPVGHTASATDAGSERHGGRQDPRMVGRVGAEAEISRRQEGRARQVAGDRSATAWGPYADAVHRWERVLGRPAPPPTEQGSKGGHRLSPAFVEWMMGLPEGHVTGVGVARTGQLKALGNGVVPLQACAAVRLLLDPD